MESINISIFVKTSPFYLRLISRRYLEPVTNIEISGASALT